jgi:integrase
MRGVFTRKTKKAGVIFWIDYIHPLTNARIRKPLPGVKTEAEAITVRNTELADAVRGVHGIKPKAKPMLFDSMIKEYLKWSKENKKSWQTDEYRAKPLRKFFKGRLLTDLNPFTVEKYKSKRSKEVTKQTVNKELIFASQVYEKALEWKKFDGLNPFKGKRYKLPKPKKPGSLEPYEVEAIMSEINHPVKRDMVEFAFNTGWRISEIRGLCWYDVDIEKGIATIVNPKNKNTVEVELNEVALAIIQRQKRRGQYVFCKLNGDNFKTNLNALIGAAATRAGVELPHRKAWHIFRRTWASMMLQAGCDVETLRVLGNWKDHSMPLWYANSANSERKRELLNNLPKLISVPQECHRNGEKGQKLAKTGKIAPFKKVVEIAANT